MADRKVKPHQQLVQPRQFSISSEQYRQHIIYDEESDAEDKKQHQMPNLPTQKALVDYQNKQPNSPLPEQLQQQLQLIRFSSLNQIQSQQNDVQIDSRHSGHFHEENSSPNSRRQSKSSSTKSKKNQYDKNIFGNISHILIKKLLSGEYLEEIDRYCRIQNISLEEFLQYFNKSGMNNIRMGVTQLHNFFNSKTTKKEIKRVFAYFMIRFLKEQYSAYVIFIGKMTCKLKYLRCATKMMYIPKLRRAEYSQIFRV